MPLFTLRKKVTIIREDESGIPYEQVVTKNYTRGELVSLVLNESATIIEVNESHASTVIRPQNKYQEIYDGVVAEARRVSDSHSNLDVDPSDAGSGHEHAVVSEEAAPSAQEEVKGMEESVAVSGDTGEPPVPEIGEGQSAEVSSNKGQDDAGAAGGSKSQQRRLNRQQGRSKNGHK